MEQIFEIYFSDLTAEKQEEYLNFEGCLSPCDLNADLVPIAVLEN